MKFICSLMTFLFFASTCFSAGENRFRSPIIGYQSLSLGDSNAAVVSSLLDIKSTSKGVLFPRMTTVQRDAISSPATGLMIYNTNLNQYQVYNGTVWASMASGGGGFFAVSSNILANPSWELDTTSWTASGGTYTRTTTTANVGSGTGAAGWDSSSAAQTLVSSDVATPAGLYNHSGVVSCNIQTPSGTATHLLQAYDDTTSTVLVSVSVTSNANYVRTSANFTFPSTNDNVQLRLVSVASNEPQIYIDDCYMGDSEGFNTFSQQIAADWNNDLSVTLTGFGSPTNNVFRYKRVGDTMIGHGSFTAGICSASGKASITLPAGLTIDNTNNKIDNGRITKVGLGHDLTSSTNNLFAVASLSNVLTYNHSDGDNLLSFAISASSTIYNVASPNSMFGDSSVVEYDFSIPIQQWANSGTVYRADQTANSWSGYHDSISGGCATTSASWADVSACTSIALHETYNRNFGTVTTAASSLPGITFTPSRAGRYQVCASVNGLNSGISPVSGIRLADGSGNALSQGTSIRGDYTSHTSCAILDVPSTSSTTVKVQAETSTGSFGIHLSGIDGTSAAISWSIFGIDSVLPAPVLVNTVTSSSSGVVRTDGARVTCGSSGSTVVSSTGSGNAWISSVSNGGGDGICTVNFSAGEFSQEPACTCNRVVSGVRSNAECQPQQATSSSIVINTEDGATGTNGDIYLQCIGLH